MRKIIYLHGFGSSGASGTAALLRRAFMSARDGERVQVLSPDIPVDPAEALPMIRELTARENPDLVVGTSLGGTYAQQLRGVERICVNPSFGLSKLYSILHVGKYKWLNERRDGAREFHVYKETIAHFAEMEAHQFDGCDEVDALFCHGLFGLKDDLTAPDRAIFESHYPGMTRTFEGGHRLNADLVRSHLLPYIRDVKGWDVGR